jgi:MoaA/NifB/PqqE/SkfB family radical SAM enzyme|tara:strand:+ start:1481 stop:2605 length:1125 start_codon:yes stop_codon:yes gene_type:complete
MNNQNLFCRVPFTEISIDIFGQVWPGCCPDWVEFPFGNILEQPWEEIWNGENAIKFRKSMYDSSLRHCDKNWCVWVIGALSGDGAGRVMENGVDEYITQIEDNWYGDKSKLLIDLKERNPVLSSNPTHLLMNYDMSCNLACPTCRIDFINVVDEEEEKVNRIHKYVIDNIFPHLHSVSITGVGDPFGGKLFRKFLMGYSLEKFPNLRSIHFNTNGQLFNKYYWEKMTGLHKIKVGVDISIDAANSETYAKLRYPGDWDTLMENFKYIKKIKNLVCLGISMVVQYENYKQMLDFIKLGESLVYNNRYTFVEFKRIRNWGHMDPEEFKKVSMGESITSDERAEFLNILREVEKLRKYNIDHNILPEIRHNLGEFLL